MYGYEQVPLKHQYLSHTSFCDIQGDSNRGLLQVPSQGEKISERDEVEWHHNVATSLICLGTNCFEITDSSFHLKPAISQPLAINDP